MTKSIKLRRRAPYWCRHRAAGRLDCLTVPLKDSEGDLCGNHADQARAARERFLAPIVHAEKPAEPVKPRRIWP